MAGAARVEGEVDDRGNHHAAESGHRGEGGEAGIAELAVHYLPFDLQADHEEEHRHEAVLDDVLQILLEVIVAYRERHVGVPEVVVGVLPGRVDPHQGGHRGDQHEHAARGFDGREMMDGTADVAGQPTGAAQERQIAEEVLVSHRR